ncbi:MAG TPA: hypothetical protein VE987_12890 [Polyangiaceae bacterium]|nr:hypothetical protein [Polyangiaceae bacterium]
MSDTEQTTPVGITPPETETTRQGKGAAAPPPPPAAAAKTDEAAKTDDDEPTGPAMEHELEGEPLATIAIAQGQSDTLITPIVTAIAGASGVALEDLHDKAKTPASLRAAIEDVTGAFFRLAARWRGKGGSSVLVIGKNKSGQIVGACEHEKGARSSTLVLDVPVASSGDAPAPAPAKKSATADSQTTPAPTAIGVTPSAPAARRPKGVRG